MKFHGEGFREHWCGGQYCGECEVCLLSNPQTGFRQFLNYWKFTDIDTGVVRCMGDELWAAQEEFARVTTEHEWIFYLKARQLGESTIACAYDGYVARCRPGVGEDLEQDESSHGANARVSIISQREKSAQKFLGFVKFGLERLPDWLQVPASKTTTSEYHIQLGRDDTRIVEAFPADSVRGDTCSHAHIDEWAFMEHPAEVWRAMEPLCAGTVHFITTGDGPENFSSKYWMKVLSGDAKSRSGTPVHGCFIGAEGGRPDYTKEWLANKARSMDEDAFLHEYPEKWEDALAGSGEYVFRGKYLDKAKRDCLGLMEAVSHRRIGGKLKETRYVIASDIGRHKDAAVIVVLDVTEDVHDVVYYQRLREVPYPNLQSIIKQVWLDYGGSEASPARRKPNVVIEKNGPGEAVAENLDLPERFITTFHTSKPSKARILEETALAFQNETLKYDPQACAQMDSELRGYQLPDDALIQDSVIALSIAESHADLAYQGGRTSGPILV